MILERHTEGRPIHELVRMFELSERQIYRILKEESGSSTQHRSGRVAPHRKRHTIKQDLPKKLLDTHGYKLWQIYKQQMEWLMEGDLSVVTQEVIPNHLSSSTE